VTHWSTRSFDLEGEPLSVYLSIPPSPGDPVPAQTATGIMFGPKLDPFLRCILEIVTLAPDIRRAVQPCERDLLHLMKDFSKQPGGMYAATLNLKPFN